MCIMYSNVVAIIVNFICGCQCLSLQKLNLRFSVCGDSNEQQINWFILNQTSPIISGIFLSADTQQTRDVDRMLFQCWADVVDGGPTLKQHWVNVSCLLGTTLLDFLPVMHWSANIHMHNVHHNGESSNIGTRWWVNISQLSATASRH